MWIESINSFETQCIREGLEMDKAGLSTKIQTQTDKTKDFHMKGGITPASQIASDTSCSLFGMKWSWLGMWGKGVRPHTEYDLAKQLNSGTVKA